MQKTVFVVSVFLFLGASFPLQAQSVATSSDADKPVAPSGPNWTRVAAPFPGKKAQQPVLLMDGSVIIQDYCSRDWWKLTPNEKGNYSTGSWRKIASLPEGYAPLYFATQTLSDGNVVVAGGEMDGKACSTGRPTQTGKAAVYDPLKNKWTSIEPIKEIGGAPAVVLPDTSLIVGSNHDDLIITLDQHAKAWKEVVHKNKVGYINHEAGWTLLPDGKVFSLQPFCEENRSRAFTFGAKKKEWALAGYTPLRLVACDPTAESGDDEVGPNLVRPDGKVVMFGAVASDKDGASTVIYDPSTEKFELGPVVPVPKFAPADAPAALLPNGDILFAASPGFLNQPTKFFRYVQNNKGDRIVEIKAIGGPDEPIPAYQNKLLILPTGQVLQVNSTKQVSLFTDAKPENSPSWAPHITDLPNKSLTREKEYSVTGLRLNGVSEGAAVGDESQTSTNYPIFRLTEKYSKQVYYCRTTKVESRSIAPDAVTTAHFLVPKNVPASGAKNSYVLEVVANGVASDPVNVVLN